MFIMYVQEAGKSSTKTNYQPRKEGKDLTRFLNARQNNEILFLINE